MLCFFNVKTVGFNYCLIDSLNNFTLRCIAALVLATLSDSKTMKDEELFSLISTRRQYYLDSMTLATLHFKLRLRRKRRTLLPKLQPLWLMECFKSIKNSTWRILKVELCWKTMHHIQHLVFSQELLWEKHNQHTLLYLKILENNSWSFHSSLVVNRLRTKGIIIFKLPGIEFP